jgi:outer membrane protein assembly factor BamB
MARVRRWAGFPLRRAAWPLMAVAALLSSLVLAVGSSGPAHAQGSADWSAFMRNASHSSYNAAATSITPANIADLQPVWRWSVPASTNGASTGLYATPVSVDGVLYVGATDGDFYAVNEATRQILWSQFLGLDPGFECSKTSEGVVSTAAVATDPSTGDLAVYVNAPDGYLYALDATTGDVLWQEVVGIPSSSESNYFAWSSPLVANGNVYVGISSRCDDPLVPAGVVGFNAGTGSSLGEWHSLPDNEDGASVWSSPAVLPSGSIIATTGNAEATSQPLYGESIVRLDGSNLGLEGSWQVPASQRVGDGDFGGSPTVFTADLNGTTTEMVGACNKNGYYYALKAADLGAGPVWRQAINNPASATGLCVSGAIWDGTSLIEGAGNKTTIDGTTYQGGVYALNPATGSVVWATGLPGEVLGSPTEDGSGVVAAQVYDSTTGNYGIYLLSAATGAILDYIPLADTPIFGQPVFAGDYLLVDGLNPFIGVTAYQITTPGSPVTAVTPSQLGQGATETLTLTGSGFTGTPSVYVSSTEVLVDSVTVVSPTTLSVKVTAKPGASPGARGITVIEPGSVADTCTSCLTVDPAPTVSSASPSSIPQGDAAAVTVAGTNFESGAQITSSAGTGIAFSGTKLVSSSELTTTATVASSVAAGSYNLRVTNPDDGTVLCTGCLTVTADPVPTVTAVSPGAVGQQGTSTLTVTGADFVPSSSVSFSVAGITAESVKYVNSTSLRVTAVITGSAPLGAAGVTVTNPGGAGTCSGCLTVDAHPAISKLSPSSIASGATTTIKVTGTNFVSGLTVTTTIPGATVGTPTSVTSTSLSVTVTVPAGATSGKYQLRVTNPDRGVAAAALSVT